MSSVNGAVLPVACMARGIDARCGTFSLPDVSVGVGVGVEAEVEERLSRLKGALVTLLAAGRGAEVAGGCCE